MYSVVGCRECRALWIVEGRPETTQCPRCRRRHQFSKLRAFAETDDADDAARVRSSMLAERADDGEFVDPEAVDVDGVGMDDVEYLSASGIDPDAVSAAGERSRDSLLPEPKADRPRRTGGARRADRGGRNRVRERGRRPRVGGRTDPGEAPPGGRGDPDGRGVQAAVSRPIGRRREARLDAFRGDRP